MARKKCPDPKKKQTTFNHEFNAMLVYSYDSDGYWHGYDAVKKFVEADDVEVWKDTYEW